MIYDLTQHFTDPVKQFWSLC